MKLHKFWGLALLSLCLTLGLLLTKGADAALSKTPNEVILWNNAALQAIRDMRPGPTITARALAIVHTAIYDAWAAYDPIAVGTQLGSSLQRPKSENTLENKKKALSYAAYRTLVDLFPSEAAKFSDVITSLGYAPTDTSTNTSTPTGIGNVAARALINVRHHDGANQLGDLHPGAYSDYTGYQPTNTPDQINDPDRWQPLRISDGHGGFVKQKYYTPQWNKVVPFALQSGAQFRPTVRPKSHLFNPEEYKKQAQQILDYSAHLSDKQKAIVEYWADGPRTEFPPGHWNLFAQLVSRRDKHSLDDDVKMFFILNNALFDASIAAWDTKLAFDYVRPLTAIHYLFKGQKVKAWGGPNRGTQEINGEDWQPYQPATVVTPPFPECVSGHSTFSAAAAEILKKFTGSDTFIASYTQRAKTSVVETAPARDITLSWTTFSAAADEAGLSRRYGGIHFEDGDLMGRTIGRKVAALVWDKAQSYILRGNEK